MALQSHETLGDEEESRPRVTASLLNFKMGNGTRAPWDNRDESSLLTDEKLPPINSDNALNKNGGANKEGGFSGGQNIEINRSIIDYSGPVICKALFPQEAAGSKESQNTVQHDLCHSQIENHENKPKRRRKNSPAIEPTCASQQIKELTESQIAAAIPENASAVFHIMDRRINFDHHSSDPSVYSLLRSWVQDDPFRKIVPSLSDMCRMAETSPPGERRLVDSECNSIPLHSNGMASKDKPTGGQIRNGDTAGTPADILSIIKQEHSEEPSRSNLLSDLISRGRKARLRDRKSAVSKATEVKLALQRKGIVLPPKLSS